jgi:hypothetical protein
MIPVFLFLSIFSVKYNLTPHTCEEAVLQNTYEVFTTNELPDFTKL